MSDAAGLDSVSAARIARAVRPSEYARLLDLPVERLDEEPFGSMATAARDWYTAHGEPFRRVRRVALAGRTTEGVCVRPGSSEPRAREPLVHLRSELLRRRLRMAEHDALVAVVASAGPSISEHASRTFPDDPSAGWFLERFGVAVVEELVREVGADARLLGPFAPGYVGWELAEGEALFELLRDDSTMPVQLLPSGMLQPSHSVCVAFGVRAKGAMDRTRLGRLRPLARRDESPCDTCSLVDCAWRRTDA